jgi:hypothetical protein
MTRISSLIQVTNLDVRGSAMNVHFVGRDSLKRKLRNVSYQVESFKNAYTPYNQ